MKTKICSFMFCLFMAVSTLSAAVWNGTANTDWYNNTDTEFTISTAEELAGLAELVNSGTDNFNGKSITLAADIMLNDTAKWNLWDSTTVGLNSWKTIGTYEEFYAKKRPFKGFFDGATHKISGIYINVAGANLHGGGLFGYTEGSIVIKNIGIMASYISIKNGSNVAGVVAVNSGVLENNYYSGVVIGGASVGGIVGENEGIVRNCYSTGYVNGISAVFYYGTYVGGIVGDNSGTVENCYSTSHVNGVSYVGGVIGINNGTIKNSYSTGSVNGQDYVGGVAGLNETMLSCYSTGSITGNNYVGGVVGSNNNSRGIIEDSYSTGYVTGVKSVSVTYRYGNTGGVVGINSGSVSNSYSIGTVIGYDYVGGVAGTNEDKGKIKNSYSTGTINGEFYVGGVAGANHNIVINSYSTSTVTAEDKFLNNISGGVVGTNPSPGKILNSYSIGIIKGKTAGGVKGAGSDSLLLNSYFAGIVNGSLLNDYLGDTGSSLSMEISKMKSKEFVATLNAFVDSVNAAQSEFIYSLWDFDNDCINRGYPILIDNKHKENGDCKDISPIQTNVSVLNISILLNGGESFKIHGLKKTEKVHIFNLKGSILLNRFVQSNENISIANLPKGVYLVSVAGKTLRFVK